MNKISRSKFLSITSTAAAAFACVPTQAFFIETTTKHQNMYGLIGNIIAKTGKRDELIDILLDGINNMPGCLSYIVSKDLEDENGIWITEVWDSKESHQASLSLPSVKEAIKQGRPLIEDFGKQMEMETMGGHGLG